MDTYTITTTEVGDGHDLRLPNGGLMPCSTLMDALDRVAARADRVGTDEFRVEVRAASSRP